MKIDIAGLKIDPFTKKELVVELERRLQKKETTWLVTAYSEFSRAAILDKRIHKLLNSADIIIADGIGIVYAEKFLQKPLTTHTYAAKVFQSFLHALAAIPKLWGKKNSIPEVLPGSRLIWDIAEISAKHSFSLFLLGGFGNTPEITAQKLIQRFPELKNKIFYSNKNPNDTTAVEDIKKAKPEILLVAYGSIKQEQWIWKNKSELDSVKLFVGLGGSFDYIAGKKIQPPATVRRLHLEWLWRLFTQPRRVKRIFFATFGLVHCLVKYKVQKSLPYRQNAVGIILNSKNEVFLAKFNHNHPSRKVFGKNNKAEYLDYWQFPQGGTKNEPDIFKAAQREIQEETGITSLQSLMLSQKTYTYEWPVFRGLFPKKRFRFRGQNQHIAYFRFSGKESEIQLDNYELIACKWSPWQNLLSEIHEEKLPLARIVYEDLKQMSEKGIL